MTPMDAIPDTAGWTADDGTFGARLALVRQRMGWGNVKEAAIACGLPPESWRTWERDGVKPRSIVEIAGMIADRTGCDYGWLLAGSSRLREGRLITTARARESSTAGTNDRSSRRPEKTRPNGHQKRTTPDDATRRPVRLRPATAL